MKKIYTLIMALIILIPIYCIGNYGRINDIPYDNTDTKLADEFNKSYPGSSVDRSVTFFEGGVLKIVEAMKGFMGTIAIIWCIYSWFLVLTAQGDDGAIKNAKTQLRWSIISLLLIFLAEPVIRNVFFGGSSWLEPGEGVFSSRAMKTGVLEIEGVIKYIQGFVALISLFMIVTVGIKTIFSEKDDARGNQKKTITWILVGILLIFLNKVLIYYGLTGNPVTGEAKSLSKTIFEISQTTKYFLSFLGLVAFGSIFYGGFMVITSVGNDDQAKTGRNIIINTFIGFLIIIISYTLVSMLIQSSG